MKKLLDKEMILYIFVGVLTTVVSIGTYFVFARIMGMHYILASILSWVLAVLFAFIANKRVVLILNYGFSKWVIFKN